MTADERALRVGHFISLFVSIEREVDAFVHGFLGEHQRIGMIVTSSHTSFSSLCQMVIALAAERWGENHLELTTLTKIVTRCEELHAKRNQFAHRQWGGPNTFAMKTKRGRLEFVQSLESLKTLDGVIATARVLLEDLRNYYWSLVMDRGLMPNIKAGGFGRFPRC